MFGGRTALALLAVCAAWGAEPSPLEPPAPVGDAVPATENTLRDLTYRTDRSRDVQLQEVQEWSKFRAQIVFLAQSSVVSTSLLLSFAIWAAFIAGRRSRLP